VNQVPGSIPVGQCGATYMDGSTCSELALYWFRWKEGKRDVSGVCQEHTPLVDRNDIEWIRGWG